MHPDHELLDMCAEALHYLVRAKRASEKRDIGNWPRDPEGLAAARNADDALLEEIHAGEKAGKNRLYWIAKKKAATAAGIYAKATICRASVTGAAGLARSLAIDLLDCEELRKSLWPAEAE